MSLQSKSIISDLFSLVRSDFHLVLLGIGALFVNSTTNLLYPWIIGSSVDYLQREESVNVSVALRTSCLFLAGGLASWIRTTCIGVACERVTIRIRKRIFDAHMRRSLESFDSDMSSEFIQLIEKDSRLAAQVFTDTLTAGVRSMNSSISGSIVLYKLSPRLCATSLCVLPIVGCGAVAISSFSKKLNNFLREEEKKSLGFAIERIKGISSIRLHGQEDRELSTYSQYSVSIEKLMRSSMHAKGIFLGFINIATNSSLLAVLYVGGKLLRRQEITTGQLVQFALQSVFVGLGFSGLSTTYGDYRRGIEAAQKIFDSLRRPVTQLKSNETKLKVLLGSIKINHIQYCYSTRPDVLVIKNISLDISPKRTVAIVGKSGSGKSTMLYMMSGLYSPSGGEITIDDIALSNIDVQNSIGVVEQDGKLLSGSVYNNIAYGRNDASMDDVIAAAKLAYAHEFISAFPLGYDTDVGENGCLLSGGQKMRIALARALIKEPKILLLDEVTSMLDDSSEQEIINTFRSEKLMSLADDIYAISDGEIEKLNGIPFHKYQD